MAVTSVVETPDSGAGGWDRLWRRTYIRTWRVKCSDRHDGPYVIRSALNAGVHWLPWIGDAYRVNATELDAGAFCTDVDYQPEKMDSGGRYWLVTARYGPYDATIFGNNPVQWPLRFSFGQQKFEKAIDTAYDGSNNPTVAIVNSAFSRFADPVTVDDSRSILTVKRNEPCFGTGKFDLTRAELYRDKLNDATWNGFAARVVKCSSITTGDQEYDSNSQTYFFPVTYIFEINRDTWRKKLLDQGYQELDSSSPPKPRPITASDGKEIKEPVLLDGSGAQLATTGTPVFITFDGYPTADFSAFNIDLAAGIGMS